MLSDPDEVLVMRSQNGERAAFEELVRRTSRLVFARLYLGTGDRHRAEDLTQETYMVAWRSVGQVAQPQGFRAWLLAVAHSVEIDAARRETRKKRTGRREKAERLAHVADPAPRPEIAVQQEEERQRVLAALRSLPEQYRLPLMLRYLAGADYDTIAQQLALSNGSLRGLLHRGMELLRTRLAQGDGAGRDQVKGR